MVALPGGEIMLSLDGQTQVFGASKGTVYGSLPAPSSAPQLKDMLVPCYRCAGHCGCAWELPLSRQAQAAACVTSAINVSFGCAGKDGRAMKRVLQWSAPPAALAFSLPHVLAMLPSSIEASPQPTMLIEPAD
jgi:hypothetical protein